MGGDSRQELDNLASRPKWGPVKFVDPAYAFVNNCAYFDYQRQRVFIRTSKTLKKHLRKPGVHLNRRIRASRHIEIIPTKCPACGQADIVRIVKGPRIPGVSRKVKRSFDLVITEGGMRRRVIECRAPLFHCSRCGRHFTSERYHRLAKHYHGLMSWAMNGHVAHRLSGGTLEAMFREFFGLTVSDTEIHVIKYLMARYYRGTYRKLFAKLVSGPVLHVDETEVKLRTGQGYVWVFASIEEVVLMFRPTRSGDFLQEALKDFRGVLVSDFYGAYDSIECPQQKCLIHLIRDVNQEILSHPFDAELQSVTQPFGSLIRSVVETVDQHGLKRKHLGHHADDVGGFFRVLKSQSFTSEAARALQERMLKYENKLFTFIRYNAVPWNNNNAENAIKQFAYYREGTVGVMKEAGLNDYLVLLSIYQTCRYKGIDFLKFLLSGLKDIDAFCADGRIRQRVRDIELYPKGFTPMMHLTAAAKAAVKKGDYEPDSFDRAEPLSTIERSRRRRQTLRVS